MVIPGPAAPGEPSIVMSSPAPTMNEVWPYGLANATGLVTRLPSSAMLFGVAPVKIVGSNVMVSACWSATAWFRQYRRSPLVPEPLPAATPETSPRMFTA